MAGAAAQQSQVFRAGELFLSQPLDGSAWRVFLLVGHPRFWGHGAATLPAAAAGIARLATEGSRIYKAGAVRAGDCRVMQLTM